MPIRVVCPSCGKVIKAPDDSAGTSGNCPSCRAVVNIPSTIEASPAPPQVVVNNQVEIVGLRLPFSDVLNLVAQFWIISLLIGGIVFGIGLVAVAFLTAMSIL